MHNAYIHAYTQIRVSTGLLRTIYVDADYSIEDVKEELSTHSNAPAPELQQLAYAGRVLQNQHTLGEYNIQKPSILVLLPLQRLRSLENYIIDMQPTRWQQDVSVLNREVTVKFSGGAKHRASGYESAAGMPGFYFFDVTCVYSLRFCVCLVVHLAVYI
jgi:hypothetical protein